MEPLEQGGLVEDLPLTDAGGEAEFAPELDPETLAAELAEARAANENYAQRLRETQAWGHRNDAERQRLSAALEQVAVNTSQPRQQAPQEAQPWRPPQLTDEQAEEWALNPKKINDAIWQVGGFAAQQATNAVRQQYEPVIQGLVNQVHSLSSQLPAAIEPAAIEAARHGAVMAEVGFGIPQDQYAAHLNAANEMLWNSAGRDMATFNQMRTNPSIVAHAVAEIRMRSGQLAPPARPPIPPSIGASPRTAAPTPRSAAVPAGAASIQEAFGIKFTPEQLRDIAQAGR